MTQAIVAAGPERAEGGEDGEGVDHVAQRARLDEADAAGSEAAGGRASAVDGHDGGTPFPRGRVGGVL